MKTKAKAVIREMMIQQLKPLILKSARLSQLLEGRMEAAESPDEKNYCQACLVENENHLRVLMGMLMQLKIDPSLQVSVVLEDMVSEEDCFEGLIA